MSDLKKVVGILFMAIGGFGIFFMLVEIVLLLELKDIGVIVNKESLFEDCMNNIAR